MTHLLDIASLTPAMVNHILERAESGTFLKHQDITMINLFFESSTRTRVSFELAAKRLGIDVINIDVATSATKKGESLLDTVYTLQSMDCELLTIRHAENGLPAFVADNVDNSLSIINAGDGTHAHPSQALLDLLTIRQQKGHVCDLSIAIMGDFAHSRVARSQISLFHKMGCKDIRVIAPPSLIPTDIESFPVHVFHESLKGLQDVDVVITLRVQKERMQTTEIPNASEYFEHYGLDQRKLDCAKPDAIVMHPGPMNRGVEIDSQIADGSQSVILEQVRNGVLIRMAILDWLLHDKN